MTLTEQIITVGMGILGVHICRVLPFLIFPPNRPIPEYIRYLGKVLPAAMFGMLVIYCYKNVDIFSGFHGFPEFLAGLITLALHLWKKNMFLSMAVGTWLYMFLVQAVFVN
ncbi:branched-chain amino acid transporter permease [Basfia succiniciproducens]|uniref:branched-chain amino acid transporter permease n=1 Tax=Basfia succiniciproducens TaxID=653940 RepID=UPI003FCD0574